MNAITSAMHLNRVFTAEADEDTSANDANSANEPTSKASIAQAVAATLRCTMRVGQHCQGWRARESSFAVSV